MENFLYMLAGTLFGGAISFAVTAFYARKGSRELQREAKGLLRRTDLIMRGLEKAGLAKYTWNEKGEIIGEIIDLEFEVEIVELERHATAKGHATHSIKVIPKDAKDDPAGQEGESRS